MELPEYDVETVVVIRADRSVLVDDRPVPLAELAWHIDEIAAGRRLKVEVWVWPPQEVQAEFLQFVRAVQAELRKAASPVVTGYHTQPAPAV